jgi:hypothetical protein
LYTEWKDGGLSTKRESEVKSHLAGCDACASLFAQLDRILTESSQLPKLSASDDVAARVLRRIRSSETVQVAPVRFTRWLAPRLAYGAAAMAVVAVCSFAFFHQFNRRPAITVAEAEVMERIYSLGPAVETTEFIVDEPDYSLGHSPSSDDVVYSLRSLPVVVRPASY